MSTDPFWDRRIETMSRDELRVIQNHRLQWQVRRCWDGSAFYRERLRAVGMQPEDVSSAEDLVRLPLLRLEELEADVRGHPPLGRGTVAPPEWWREHQMPRDQTSAWIPSVWTEADIVNRVNLAARALWSCGLRPGHYISVDSDVRASILDATIGAAGQKVAADRTDVTGGGAAVSWRLPNRPLDALGAPGRVRHLPRPPAARWVRAVDTPSLGPDVAEPAWRVFYAPELGPTVAAECPSRTGLHWAEDHFLVELLNPTTHSDAQAGTVGVLVVTQLTREGTPLIRYWTGRYTTLDPSPCSCNRTHIRSVGVISEPTDDRA